LEALGPVTAAALAAEAGVPRGTFEAALGALEAEGFAQRGRFTPRAPESAQRANGNGGEPEEEWCERRLLARIHRYTLGRLRREIQPVGVADFSRFLLDWQRVAPGERGEGVESLAAVLDQLEGFEAAAAAWEGDLLPARLDGYDPAWLDQLCLSGRYVWCRLTPPAGDGRQEEEAGWDKGRAVPAGGGRTTESGQKAATTDDESRTEAGWGEQRAAAGNGGVRLARRGPRGAGTSGGNRPRRRTRPAPIRSTPLALVRRERLQQLRALGAGRASEGAIPPALSADAQAVRDRLEAGGASFFADLVRGTGLLRTQVEAALAELAALGRVTSDGFTGLRALLVPANKKPSAKRRRRTAVPDMASAGRWSLLPPGGLEGAADGAVASGAPGPGSPGATRPGVSARAAADEAYREAVEAFAWTLLHRYGVVFRKLLDRESAAPPWRDLLRAFRRLEARGEIRGGRFVDGFSGEQYAHTEAVPKLRAVRRRPPGEALVSVSAADPLNLVGILTPGARLAALAPNRLLYRGGLPAALRESGEVRFLDRPLPGAPAEPRGPGTAEAHWEAEKALLRRPVPPELRAYLG
jgi:ATP-dependent Lhr-like helicase